MKTLRITYLVLLCILIALPLSAQESAMEQFMSAHSMSMLTADSIDPNHHDLVITALAMQQLTMTDQPAHPAAPHPKPSAQSAPQSCILQIDTLSGRAELLSMNGQHLADVHFTLVDSTWYMWLSVDPLADKNIQSSPYLYCNGNPIMLVDPDGRDVAILLAHNGAWGMGHMAILIQDEDKVWHLYSKNGEGKAQSLGANPNDRGEIRANSVADFLNNKADNTVTHVEGDDFPYYTAALIIKTSPEQDKIIQNGVEAKLDEPYNFFFNNCTEAVQKGLRDAGVNAIPTIIPIRSFYYMWYMIPDSQIIEPTTDELEK